MTVNELADKLELTVAAGDDGMTNTVDGCYIGDLLSLAMSKVGANNVWVTIQTNINVVAVMVLTDASCVIMCEGQKPDEATKSKADNEGVPILTTDKSAYHIAKEFAKLGI